MAGNEITNHSTSKNFCQMIRGLPVHTIYKADVVEAVLDYMPHDGDVIITSYPKTGSTWMQFIIQQIVTRGASLPTYNDMLTKIIPSVSFFGLSAIETMTTKPRIYKHHFPYDKVQKNPNAKIIYVYRKPEDTFVSLFHYMNNIGLEIDFDQYFEEFLSGILSFGCYFEHVLSYLEHKDDKNILLVSYEKLQIWRKEEILRIAEFLDIRHYDALINDTIVMDKIMKHTNFDYMKQNLFQIIPFSVKENSTKYLNFFRKGIVGEGKKELTELQFSRLRELTKETMTGTKILEEWLQD